MGTRRCDAGIDEDAIGAAMRLARHRLGLSQRELADALGWDRAKVGRWESSDLPSGFWEVVSLLRTLGFGLSVTDVEAGRWADRDEPSERIVDRGARRFPAHLELTSERPTSKDQWTRHRGKVSPHAGGMSFRRRRAADAAEWGKGDSTEWAKDSATGDPDSGQPEGGPPEGTDDSSEAPDGMAERAADPSVRAGDEKRSHAS